MLSPAVLFTAITIVSLVSEIYCNLAPAQELDLQKILELAQQQSLNKDREDKDDRYESDSRQEDKNHYGSLKSQEIAELVNKATQDRKWRNKKYDDTDSDERKIKSSQKHRNRVNTDKGQYYYDLIKELNENNLNDGLLHGYQSNVKNTDKYEDVDEHFKHSHYNQESLEQLLSQNVLNKKYQRKPRYRVKLSNLAGSLESKSDRTEDRNNLDAYLKLSNVMNRDKYKDVDEVDDSYKHSRYNQEALEQLLSQNVLDKKIQSKPRYRLKPNTLVGSLESKSDRTEDRNNLGAYSKVYVILNPKAIAKSANKDKLNNLLANILSLTSSSYGSEKGNKEYRYKGFPVLPELLARRRASRENSVEEESRPKRIRSERGNSGGGGGGGGGGRTPIPYIRHRGDIYERDN